MSDVKTDPVYWLPRIALALFVFGSILIGIGFTQPESLGGWFRFGTLFWLAAYFLVLLDNFRRKIPVQTRGGIVRVEDGPTRYAAPYVLLLLIGVIASIILLFSFVEP